VKDPWKDIGWTGIGQPTQFGVTVLGLLIKVQKLFGDTVQALGLLELGGGKFSWIEQPPTGHGAGEFAGL
jgi:hypothetical protein